VKRSRSNPVSQIPSNNTRFPSRPSPSSSDTVILHDNNSDCAVEGGTSVRPKAFARLAPLDHEFVNAMTRQLVPAVRVVCSSSAWSVLARLDRTVESEREEGQW
jgi:hypothetical protein